MAVYTWMYFKCDEGEFFVYEWDYIAGWILID